MCILESHRVLSDIVYAYTLLDSIKVVLECLKGRNGAKLNISKEVAIRVSKDAETNRFQEKEFQETERDDASSSNRQCAKVEERKIGEIQKVRCGYFPSVNVRFGRGVPYPRTKQQAVEH